MRNGMKKKVVSEKIILWLSTLVIVIYMVSSIAGEKYLYIDGSNYLFGIIASKRFQIYPLGRATFDYLTQIFSVLSIRMGCRSIKIISILFGFGLTFWPALAFFLTMSLCHTTGNHFMERIVFLTDSTLLLVWGFFLQQESVWGFAHYFLLLILSLYIKPPKAKHCEEKDMLNSFFCVVWCIGSLICYHLNEYYSLWSLVLSGVILYRLYCNELPKTCVLLALWHIFVSWTSYLSISARGEAPTVQMIIENFFNHKYFVVVLVLLGTYVLVGLFGDRIPITKQRLKNLFLWLVIALYSGFNVWYVFKRTHLITTRGFGNRFALLGIGTFGGILLAISVLRQKKKTAKEITIPGMDVLCIIQAFFLCACLCISGIQYYNYNSYVALDCKNGNGAENHIVKLNDNSTLNNDIALTYYFKWSLPPQSVISQVLRGEKNISYVYEGAGFYTYEKELSSFPDISDYGITYVIDE